MGLAITWYAFLAPHSGETTAGALCFAAAVLTAAGAGGLCDRVQQARFRDQQQLRRSELDARLLQQLSAELTRQDDVASLYQRFVEGASAIMRSQFASMQMFYPHRGSRGELRLLAQLGFPAEAVRLWEWVSGENSNSTCGQALRADERVIVADVASSAILRGTRDAATYLAAGILAVQSTPLRSRNGRLLGMISTHWNRPYQPAERDLRNLDILARQAADLIECKLAESDREHLLASERAARAEAEQAARMKDEFLSMLSHELRTPLSAVLGWVSMIEKRPGDQRLLTEGLPVIARNARLQAKLISDLLDMGRILAGKIRLEFCDVDLPEIVNLSIQSAQFAAQEKQIRVETVFEPIDAPIRGDPARLQQILANLLSNAVKFTPERGSVGIHVRRHENSAEISVSDTGSGIAPEFLPRVFDKFTQADASTTRQFGGLGLGLAMVKHLVELHGGAVSANSAGQGLGSTFTVQLPLALEASSLDGNGRPAENVFSEDVDLSGVKILAVDDHRDAVALVQRILEDCRAQVLIAGSAEEALRLILRERPDVILCDLGMPRRDGYEFVRELRASGDDTPAIALTAFVRPEDRHRALKAGFNAHLPKPVDPAGLVAAVRSFARAFGLRFIHGDDYSRRQAARQLLRDAASGSSNCPD